MGPYKITKTKKENSNRHYSPVPNNPRDNQLYINKKEMNKERKFNRDMMLFDKVESVLQKVVSKTEPLEPRRTEILRVDKDKFNKDLDFWKKRNQQSAAKERLKRKGAVPTKSGKKLFEDFMRDMKEATGNNKQQSIDDADFRNIYNAATQLDYDKWLWWVMNEYKNRI